MQHQPRVVHSVACHEHSARGATGSAAAAARGASGWLLCGVRCAVCAMLARDDDDDDVTMKAGSPESERPNAPQVGVWAVEI